MAYGAVHLVSALHILHVTVHQAKHLVHELSAASIQSLCYRYVHVPYVLQGAALGVLALDEAHSQCGLAHTPLL